MRYPNPNPSTNVQPQPKPFDQPYSVNTMPKPNPYSNPNLSKYYAQTLTLALNLTSNPYPSL